MDIQCAHRLIYNSVLMSSQTEQNNVIQQGCYPGLLLLLFLLYCFARKGTFVTKVILGDTNGQKPGACSNQ